MTAETDSLISAVRGGQTDAFAEIVRRFQADAWKVAAACLHDFQSTENIVQQAFVDAYLHLDQFQAGGDFAAWLKAIVRNLVRQELRARGREDRRMEVYREHLRARLSDDAAQERRERAYVEALADCRRKLDDSGRRALELRYERSWSFERIAAELGRTVAATRQLLNRIRSALRECIERKPARA